METFALFEDATASRIVYGFFDPDPDGTPIKLIPLGISDPQVKRAAERGCFAAYQLLRRLGYIDDGEKYCLSYDFATEGRNSHVLGESAGLAFCLKFAQEVYQQKTGKRLNYSLAATGVISDGTEKAAVRRIEGIRAKLQAAMTYLNTGDKVFYPGQNEDEISPEMHTEATETGIELIPVSTATQALTRLMEKYPQEEYPIEVEGLNLGSEPGQYQVFRRLHVGRKIRLPLQVVNNGNQDVILGAGPQGAGTDWLKLSLAGTTLRSQKKQEVSVNILPGKRLRFLLQHSWKCFFRKEATLSLHFHIPESEPYVLVKNIDVRVHFTNLWPVVLLLLALSGYTTYFFPLSQWDFRVFREHRRESVTLVLPWPTPEVFLPQVMKDLEQGKYLEAKTKIEHFLNHSLSGDKRFLELHQQITNNLSIKILYRTLL